MKTTLMISVLLALGILGTAFKISQQKPWVAPDSNAKVANPVKSDAASLEAGKALYTKTCKECHGTKGKGDGPKTEELDKVPGDFTKADFQKQTDGAIFWKMTEGRKPMPSFKKDFSETQRWQLVNYLRTLGGSGVKK